VQVCEAPLGCEIWKSGARTVPCHWPGTPLFTSSFEPAESKVVCVLHNYPSLRDESGRGLSVICNPQTTI